MIRRQAGTAEERKLQTEGDWGINSCDIPSFSVLLVEPLCCKNIPAVKDLHQPCFSGGNQIVW